MKFVNPTVKVVVFSGRDVVVTSGNPGDKNCQVNFCTHGKGTGKVDVGSNDNNL